MLHSLDSDIPYAHQEAEEALRRRRGYLDDSALTATLAEFAPEVDASLFRGIEDAVRTYDASGYGGGAIEAAMIIAVLVSLSKSREDRDGDART